MERYISGENYAVVCGVPNLVVAARLSIGPIQKAGVENRLMKDIVWTPRHINGINVRCFQPPAGDTMVRLHGGVKNVMAYLLWFRETQLTAGEYANINLGLSGGYP